MAQGSGFDMSRISTASKILLGGGIAFLIVSLVAWQRACPVAGIDLACTRSTMWGGSGSFFGVIAGLLALVLIAWEALMLANVDLDVGMDRAKLSAYIGFGVLGFGLLKFIFALANSPAIGAWLGLIVALVIGYGAWMRFQEPAASAPPPPPVANDGSPA
jgi:hypothetical protein